MRPQLSEAYAMTNYVIVEVTCQVCGKTTAKLSAAGWDAHTSCPTCRRECESVYLGHGFSSDHSLEAMHDDDAPGRYRRQVC